MRTFRYVAFSVLAVWLSCGVALAAEVGTPEYERLKEYKRMKREERANRKASPGSEGPSFWQKEAERSGLNRFRLNLDAIPGAIKKMNPMPFLKEQNERYQQRKATVK